MRCMVRNEHTFKTILLKNSQDPDNINVPGINKRLAVIRHFVLHIPTMDISEFPLPAVSLDSLVDVALGHLGKGAKAELKRICLAVIKIKHSLI